MREAEAEREQAQYNLDHATICAPANEYCLNLQLRTGMLIRLKPSVVNFVATDETADVFVLLRKLAIRSESWLNYPYNPF